MKKLFLMLGATFALSTSFYTEANRVSKEKSPKYFVEKLTSNAIKPEVSTKEIYNSIDFTSVNKLNPDVFDKAYLGFQNLKKAGKLSEDTKLITICDFSLSSNEKRLWIVDLEAKKVLYNTLVAHGKNTGEEFAEHFSNTESSLQSSMGFYITDATYNGENGYSLKLLGMDKGFNDAALQRSIVMHGADYVSEEFAAQHQRIGRSWGCPAVPRSLTEPIINTIKGKNVLFIFYPDENYLQSSEWLHS